jgi:arylsulfatase A-like enzyme
MIRRKSTLFLCLFVFVHALTIVRPCDAADKPNIVLFLVDDMGPMDTSVPFMTDEDGKAKRYPLNDYYRTPNMERLAKQGTRLSQFYAMSVCSPSRTSLITGQNATRHGVTQYIKSQKNNRGKFGPPEWNWTGFDNPKATLAGVLKSQGYHTIFVGKAHFGPIGAPTEFPTYLGYDVNIAGCSWGQPGSYYAQDGYGLIKGWKERAVPDLDKYHGTDTFLTEALTIEGKAAVDDAVKSGKPFFLHFAPYAVHAPFQANPRYLENYPKSEEHKHAQAFGTLVESMDTALGELMDQLEAKGVADNTLILFLGDNGSDAPLGRAHEHTGSFPLRGIKATHYEGGTRTPFMAAWAKHNPDNPWQKKLPIARGQINTQLGTIMDIYPTILNLIGAQAPEGHVLDGFDLSKQLLNQPNPDRPVRFLMHFPHDHRSSYFTSLRLDDWKLIYQYTPHNPAKDHIELFNLKEDPFETTNVARKEPGRVKQLIREMIKQLEAENALYPVDADGNELKPIVPD